MDQLEKYIRDHRDEFDSRMPQEDLWQAIEQHFGREHRLKPVRSTWLWKAASIILLICVTGLLIERQVRQAQVSGLVQSNEQLAQFRQVEEYYTSLINNKRTEITGFLDSNPAFRNEFTSDITQLDSMYIALREKLRENYNEKIIDAMTVNLRMQIEILNQQLDILKKIKTQNEHEKTSI